ncbi:hypothetical protein PR048_020853 [Dryococelus australis]|uniref:Uncharacterized protein n=1 Tax=Dryococelus australis TaxID=614101 RepID=A0ABQ9GWJ6_9NEOP|nr:hypothetical protein PR048_020853 [Dryococelus australis]
MQRIPFDATAKLISKQSVATSASVKLILKKTVALSRDKLCSLMAADPDKQHFDCIKVFDPKYLVRRGRPQHIVTGFRDLQNNLKKHATESGGCDIVKALAIVKMYHPNFAKKCFEAIWLPSSNVDSEGFLLAYSSVLSDRKTNLSQTNLESMSTFILNITSVHEQDLDYNQNERKCTVLVDNFFPFSKCSVKLSHLWEIFL